MSHITEQPSADDMAEYNVLMDSLIDCRIAFRDHNRFGINIFSHLMPHTVSTEKLVEVSWHFLNASPSIRGPILKKELMNAIEQDYLLLLLLTMKLNGFLLTFHSFGTQIPLLKNGENIS